MSVLGRAPSKDSRDRASVLEKRGKRLNTRPDTANKQTFWPRSSGSIPEGTLPTLKIQALTELTLFAMVFSGGLPNCDAIVS